MLYAYHAFQGLAHLESPKRDAGLDFMRQHVPRHVWFCPAIRWDDPNFSGTRNGSVTAFAIQPDGGLKFLNVINSQGGGPAHLSVDPSGKWVFAANYGTAPSWLRPEKRTGRWGMRPTGKAFQPVLWAPIKLRMALFMLNSFQSALQTAATTHLMRTRPRQIQPAIIFC